LPPGALPWEEGLGLFSPANLGPVLPRPDPGAPEGIPPADAAFIFWGSKTGSFDLRGAAESPHGLWEADRALGRSGPQLPPPGAEQESRPGEDAPLPPLYLAVLPLPVGGKPLAPEVEGYRFLCAYAGRAIRNAERRVGPLRDHEDIVQQICVEWLEEVGPPEEAFPKLLENGSPEKQLLRQTVNRVIARTIYQQRKRLLIANFTQCPAPAEAAQKEWLDFKSDCEKGVGNLTHQEWQILELRRQGKTFAEIGAEMELPKQRVWETYQGVEARLRKIYGNA
jgi:hypothetical protein